MTVLVYLTGGSSIKYRDCSEVSEHNERYDENDEYMVGPIVSIWTRNEEYYYLSKDIMKIEILV